MTSDVQQEEGLGQNISPNQEDPNQNQSSNQDPNLNQSSNQSVPNPYEKTLILNFDYIKTNPGIFKCITVMIGLFAMAFTSAALDQAYYYNYRCTNAEQAAFKKASNLWKNDPRYGGGAPLPKTCEEFVPVTNDFCLYANRYKDWLDKVTHAPPPKDSILEKFQNMDRPKCPPKWLFIPSVYIIAVTWTVSFLFLIVMLLVDLDRYQNISRWFQIMDFFGHLTAAVLFGGSTGSMIYFLVMVFTSNYPCTDDDFKKDGGKKSSRGSRSRLTSRGYLIGAQNDYINGKLHDCEDYVEATYEPWYILIGLMCAAATTVMYVVTAIILKRQGSLGPAVAPDLMEEPSMTPRPSTEMEVPPTPPTPSPSSVPEKEPSPIE